ncbi:Putative serine/threonine-protein kinase pknH [Minicystis rosea]|nr:Putative serine/threonine-protein kinase pknH [Minicystis rosea]
MAQLTLAEGSIFGGRYKIVRCIAMGGMGAVYEVIHQETERRRALKVMLPHVVGSEDLRNRFRQEARVAAHIESQHIVDVFDAGVDEATSMPFLVMELLQGDELGRLLKKVGRFPPKDVVTYIHQTALALDKTHRASIVHRDLKPENLFLTQREDGQPHIKVLDFGIAKIMADSSTQAQATRSLGTPLYMAPEQFRSNVAITPAADIYALGMMVFTLLAGASYWHKEMQGESNVFAFAMATSGGPPEPATLRAERVGVQLPAAFDAWFAKCTAVQPANRFQTAGAAASALAEALGIPLGGTVSLSSIVLQTSDLVPVNATPAQPTSAPSVSSPFQQTPTGAAVTSAPAGSNNRRLILGASAAAFVLAGGITTVLLARGRPAVEAPAASAVTTEIPHPTAPTVTAAASTTATVVVTPTALPTATAAVTAVETAAPVQAHAPATKTGPSSTAAKTAAPAVTAKIHSRD